MYAAKLEDVRDQKAVDLLNAAIILAKVEVPSGCMFHITRDSIDLKDPDDDRWVFYVDRTTLNFFERYDTCMLYAADWRNEGWEYEGNLKEAPETYRFTELEAPL